MPGVNRYGQGIPVTKNVYNVSPTVFISHSSRDKHVARIVANRLKSRNVDIYFDEDDRCLGAASGSDKDIKIVRCIQQGIKYSTHTLCVLSLNSLRSPWVSYEIGYAASEEHPLAVLVLKDVDQPPSFIKVAQHVLVDIWDLEKFIISIKNEPESLHESVRKNASLTDIVTILPDTRTVVNFANSGD